MLPYPVRTMPRASGRRCLSAEITSRPLPSARRISTTAKAGAARSTSVRPSATDSAVVTANPRPSMARARRCRNDLSSSTISSVRSPGIAATRFSVMIDCASVNKQPCSTYPLCIIGMGLMNFGKRRRFAFVGTSRFGGTREFCFSFIFLGLFCFEHIHIRQLRNQRTLKIRALPAHPDDCTTLRKLLVFQGNLGAGPRQERLCDEEPQAEPRHLAPAHPPAARARHVRLTHAVDDFRREARSIVVDLDHDLIIGPGRGHLDTLA